MADTFQLRGEMLLANPSFSNWEKTNLELFNLLTGSEHEVQAAHVLEDLNFDPRTRERSVTWSRPLAQLTGLDASLSNRVDLECFDGKVICVLRWRARFMCDARTSPLILSLLALCVCQGAAITIPHEVVNGVHYWKFAGPQLQRMLGVKLHTFSDKKASMDGEDNLEDAEATAEQLADALAEEGADEGAPPGGEDVGLVAGFLGVLNGRGSAGRARGVPQHLAEYDMSGR